MEKYIKINGFVNYEVSNFGNIRNTRTNKKLKPCKFKNSDYLYVDLCLNSKKNRFLIHRLVAEAFLSNTDDKEQVNHKNGDKSDNKVSNLEWNTRSENQRHSIMSGLRTAKGIKNSQSKLNESQVLSIFYNTKKYAEISKEFNISIPTISDIKRGHTWKHITKKKT